MPLYRRSNFHNFSTIPARVRRRPATTPLTAKSPTARGCITDHIQNPRCARFLRSRVRLHRYGKYKRCSMTTPPMPASRPGRPAPSESTDHPPSPPRCVRSAPTDSCRASPRSSSASTFTAGLQRYHRLNREHHALRRCPEAAPWFAASWAHRRASSSASAAP